ncbi:MAG TPA: hypothetical protein VMU16_10870 [Candidatus Binataceae bacterium]|nr:hypothetical protein [Candidatus Binataceae bacterium]
MTITTPPQAAQNNQPPSGQPYVTVGISGMGVTLQPINTKPGGDNQMWYAIEATSGQRNPSYLISSLPADVLPDASDSTLVTQQLALGYFGNPGANAAVNAASSVQYALNASAPENIFGSFALTSNPFTLGQTVSINATPNVANGAWTIQQLSGNAITYTIPKQVPYTDYNLASTGNATAMAAVYLNQQNTPASRLDPTYTNEFQQWTYNSGDQTICNGFGACLNSADSAPQAGSVVTASAKPSPVPANFQWSFYPNYELSQILSQADIPFPTLPAHDYKNVNSLLTKLGYPDVAAATCTLDGVAYSGLRCEYSNLAAPLSAYLIAVSHMAKVSLRTRRQLTLELTDAIAVQNLFNQISSVFTVAFLGNEDLISQDLGDMGMDLTDQTSTTTWRWEALVSGIVYTLLNGLGGFLGTPALGSRVKTAIFVGAVANAMTTGIDTYLSEEGSGTLPLANEFETTAADLYTNFYLRYLNFYSFIADQETKTLTDWGRLAVIGALAQDTGRDGLALDPKASVDAVAVATQSYQLNLMAQLLPQFFTLYAAMDWVGGAISTSNPANGLNSDTIGMVVSSSQSGVPSPMPTPDPTLVPPRPQLLNQFATPVDPQGAQFGMWDVGWLHFSQATGNGSKLTDTYLTQQLAQDVQYANPYLLYNGFGMWSGFNGGYTLTPSDIANLTCDAFITTMTNYTPKALAVSIVSTKNTAIGGGYGPTYHIDLHGDGGYFSDISDTSGIVGPALRSLPPYGVLQFGATAIDGSGSARQQYLTVQIWDYNTSTAAPVASYQVRNLGCTLGVNSVTDPYSQTSNSGYFLYLPPVYQYYSAGRVSVAIYGGN